jgi:hypothetical protein
MMLCFSTSGSDILIPRSLAETVARDMVDRSRMFLGMKMMEMMNAFTQSISSSPGKLSTTRVSANSPSSRDHADQ